MLASLLREGMGKALDIIEKPIESHIHLETTESETVFVGRSRELISLFRVIGTRNIKDDEDRGADITTLVTELKPILAEIGYGIELHYTSDPERGPEAVSSQLAGARSSARSVGLAFDPLLDAQEAFLGARVRAETYHIVIWSMPTVLPPIERKAAIAESQEAYRQWSGRGGRDAQNPFKALSPMANRHDGVVRAVKTSFEEVGIEMEILEVHDAADDIFADLWGERDAGFRLVVPGDPAPTMVPDGRDPSAILWPKIGRQLSPWRARRYDWEIVRMGNRLIATIDVFVGPQEAKDFAALRDRLTAAGVPFRMSFRMRSGGEKLFGWGAQLSTFGAIFGGRNRAVRKSYERVKERADADGCVTWQASFATWVDVTHPDAAKQIKLRQAILRSCVGSWGTMLVRPMSGDPLAAALSSALGISQASTAETGYAPLKDVFKMMPRRVASPWASGSIPLITEDGAIFPYEEGSQEVAYSLTLVYAVMRSGKSAWLWKLCLGSVLAAGMDRLPFLLFLDVGFGSMGLIETLREALPPGRRSEVEHIKVRMNSSCARNLLDPPLGCRYAPDFQISMMEDAFSLLATPAEADKPHRGLGTLMGRLMKKAYQMKDDASDSGDPNLYIEGTDYEVDRAITRLGIKTTSDAGTTATWWRIVDSLMREGEPGMAGRAQRYAAPWAEDLLKALASTEIQEDFKTYFTDQNVPLTQAVEAELRLALSQFPICAGPTQFEPSARVMALDLQGVLGQGDSPAAKKQTKVAYTWFMMGSTNRWWTEPRDVLEDPTIPTIYKAWHMKQAEDMAATPKIFVGDEYHSTDAAPNVRAIIKKMVLKGPKYRMRMILASQILSHFDDELLELASAMFALSYTEASIDEMKRRFKLNRSQCEAMRRLGKRHPKYGQPMFAHISTAKRGKFSQIVYNAMSPRELWAAATNPLENRLRLELTKRTGSFMRAVELLSVYEPFQALGAEKEIELRIKRYIERGDVEAAKESSVIEELVADMNGLYREHMLRKMQGVQ